MKISIFGLGYVGAVGCGCLANLGHQVIGVDVSAAKVELMRQGAPPIAEPGLNERLAKAVREGRLSATLDPVEAVCRSDIAMVCVGTPSTSSGGINTRYLETVCQQIGQALAHSASPFFTVMVRSTSLPPVHRKLQELLQKHSGRKLGETLGYVCHPEFLREGAAVYDFDNPPKIVYGISDDKCRETCQQLYPGIAAPTMFVSVDLAAMVKYADNNFHAVKVTFANEIGLICHQFGVDAHAVMNIFCQDTKLNISNKYLRPGTAFGGSCLPKDLRAMLDAARQHAVAMPMLAGVMASNRTQIESLLDRILEQDRPGVGIVGLTFKEGTDDVRESPMVAVVEQLTGKGCPVRVFDPHLSLQKMVGANKSFALQSIPHLADLLTDDLPAMVASSQVVVVSYKLDDATWSKVKWRKDQRVIDLVNIPSLHAAPGYDGLYW